MSYVPKLTSSVDNVVSNFKSTVPALRDIAGWRIDMAHREWCVSEDFGNDETLVNWLPDDTDQRKLEYMEIQQQDLRRAIRELINYNSDLQIKIRQLGDQIRELST